MSAKVVDIGEMRIHKMAARGYDHTAKPKCPHKQITIDPNGCIVTCNSCNQQIEAFWAIAMLVDYYSTALDALQSQTQKLHDTRKSLESENIHLIAARKVEHMWRGRKFMPGCINCRRGILPEDIGQHSVPLKSEMERRQFEGKKT